ncbi:hypothetical protein MKW92_001833 [Papaver armeniacum]|nr:hypothetical protein MKW92_001833 [Papaver armeniacum]
MAGYEVLRQQVGRSRSVIFAITADLTVKELVCVCFQEIESGIEVNGGGFGGKDAGIMILKIPNVFKCRLLDLWSEQQLCWHYVFLKKLRSMYLIVTSIYLIAYQQVTNPFWYVLYGLEQAHALDSFRAESSLLCGTESSLWLHCADGTSSVINPSESKHLM